MGRVRDDGRRSDLDDLEQVERIEAIVRRMPRRTRAVFQAYRVVGLPYEEIARRTGLSVRRIERHMVRALVLLDRGLNERRPWWKFW